MAENGLKPKLSRSSAPSFRLQNQSLNSLRLRRIFDLFDTNNDGELSVTELTEALKQLGLGAEEDDVSSTISSHFKSNRDTLDFDDFQNLHRAIGDSLFGGIEEEVSVKEEEMEENLLEAFKVFDENDDGFISASELQNVLKKLGMVEGRELGKVQAMICKVDHNNDGMVDLVEFKHMMRSISINGVLLCSSLR